MNRVEALPGEHRGQAGVRRADGESRGERLRPCGVPIADRNQIDAGKGSQRARMPVGDVTCADEADLEVPASHRGGRGRRDWRIPITDARSVAWACHGAPST